MWQVIIDDVINKSGSITVRVTLTDGTKKIRPDEFSVNSKADLDNKLNNLIDSLSGSDSEIIKIPVGIYDPTPPPLTPEQNEFNLYAFMLGRLPRLKHAIDLGLTDKLVDTNRTVAIEYAETQKYLLDNFKPEYLELF